MPFSPPECDTCGGDAARCDCQPPVCEACEGAGVIFLGNGAFPTMVDCGLCMADISGLEDEIDLHFLDDIPHE